MNRYVSNISLNWFTKGVRTARQDLWVEVRYVGCCKIDRSDLDLDIEWPAKADALVITGENLDWIMVARETLGTERVRFPAHLTTRSQD